MKYSSRFFLYAPPGVFLAILAAVGVHWWIAASHLAGRLDAANGREIMPGVRIAYASHRTTGFPFSLDTEFRDLTVSVATPDGVTRWRTAEFAMHALTYGRAETVFEAAGPQRLAWTDAGGGALDFAVGSLHASAIVRKGVLARFDLDLFGLGSKAFTAQRLQLHFRTAAPDRLEYLVAADGLQFASESPTYNQPVAIRVPGTMTEAHALAAWLRGDQRWYEALERWRKSGGALHAADTSSFEKCGLKLVSPGGDFRLDKSHALRGRLTFRFKDIPKNPKLPAAGCRGFLDDAVGNGFYVGFGVSPVY